MKIVILLYSYITQETWIKLCPYRSILYFYGSNEGKIHACLYDLKSDSEHEFISIISQNCTQFICESNPFRFITHLSSVLEEYHGTSH